MIKTKDRFGVLEVQTIDGDMHHMACLVHTDRRPLRLTAKQLETAIMCPACCNDNATLRKNAVRMTGRTFGGYVAIKLMGLSTGAATVKRNQKQWQGKAKLDHNTYCRHKYWKVYNVKCRHEIELRGDVLRAGKTPKRCPVCHK